MSAGTGSRHRFQIDYYTSFLDLCCCALGGAILLMVMLAPKPPVDVDTVDRQVEVSLIVPQAASPAGGLDEWRHVLSSAAPAIKLYREQRLVFDSAAGSARQSARYQLAVQDIDELDGAKQPPGLGYATGPGRLADQWRLVSAVFEASSDELIAGQALVVHTQWKLPACPPQMRALWESLRKPDNGRRVWESLDVHVRAVKSVAGRALTPRAEIRIAGDSTPPSTAWFPAPFLHYSGGLARQFCWTIDRPGMPDASQPVPQWIASGLPQLRAVAGACGLEYQGHDAHGVYFSFKSPAADIALDLNLTIAARVRLISLANGRMTAAVDYLQAGVVAGNGRTAMPINDVLFP